MVNFVFVSCQDFNEGKLEVPRTRIPEDHKVRNFYIPLTFDGYRDSTKAIWPTPTFRMVARGGRSW